jgi:hypothetical protein
VPVFQDMPANDIDFYVHELCSLSRDLMWRMMRGGHIELALMTATEMLERVEGVEPVIACAPPKGCHRSSPIEGWRTLICDAPHRQTPLVFKTQKM